MFDELLVVGMFSDVRFERFHASTVLPGFLLDLQRGVLGFNVIEDHVGAGLREEFDGRRTDSS